MPVIPSIEHIGLSSRYLSPPKAINHLPTGSIKVDDTGQALGDGQSIVTRDCTYVYVYERKQRV